MKTTDFALLSLLVSSESSMSELNQLISDLDLEFRAITLA